jgi:Variant SH3 domain
MGYVRKLRCGKHLAAWQVIWKNGIFYLINDTSSGATERKEQFMTSTWKVRAVKASRPENPYPIKMHAGDLIELAGNEDDGWIWCRHPSGKESWVPMSYLSTAGEGHTRTALVDYDATELPVEVGEVFQAEREESGWLWCENTQGQWGWVRVAQVERIDQA